MCVCALHTRVRCFPSPAKNTCLPLWGAVASIENVCFNVLGLERKVDEQIRENPGDGEEDKFTPHHAATPSVVHGPAALALPGGG